MAELRKRILNEAVWIPLRANIHYERVGNYGDPDFKEDYFGAGSVAMPTGQRGAADSLNWGDLGLGRPHGSHFDRNGIYLQADVFQDDYKGLKGSFLVLEQYYDTGDHVEWHLANDLTLALGLKREGDVWIRPEQGYLDIARLRRKPDESPSLLEIRASFLKDYLSARNMALRVSWFRERAEISPSREHIAWEQAEVEDDEPSNSWHGTVREISLSSGMPIGSRTSVFWAGRAGLDSEVDVPNIGMEEGMQTASFEAVSTGPSAFYVRGELWRDEWVEPAELSPIVRADKVADNIYFYVDSAGQQESAETLTTGSRWLWFRPSLVDAILRVRGGSLRFYTRDTGGIATSPNSGVHFGLNSLGLVNIFAKDVGELPHWQQRLWVSHNVIPEGGVSQELIDAQMKSNPARTSAPEAFLEVELNRVNENSARLLGFNIFVDHPYVAELLPRVHRFRALDYPGLLELAKDVTRLITDRIDQKAIKGALSHGAESLGSLKSLERLMVTRVGEEAAHQMMGPLFGAYTLRLADAHLPATRYEKELSLVNIDLDTPPISQGFHLLDSCVSCLASISEALTDEH